MKKLLILLISFVFLCGAVYSEDVIMQVLEEEIAREMKLLKAEEVPPYFLSYRVNDIDSYTISSSFGNTMGNVNNRNRFLTISVRVGDYELDNSEELRDDRSSYFYSMPGAVQLPQDDNPDALRKIIWKNTDSEYKKAVDKLAKVKANMAIKVEKEDKSDSFSREKPSVYYEPPLSDIDVDMDMWQEKLNRYSELFLKDKDIHQGTAFLRFSRERKYFVSSEGTKVAHNYTSADLSVGGSIKADDGMVLPVYKSYFAFSLDSLPDDETVLKDVKELVEMLAKLKKAPAAEPYSGPAIMSGSAASVFFHEIFGHRLEGHRQKRTYEGQTFKDMVGQMVLPEHMSVIFDPKARTYEGFDLSGYYLYDDEGIEGQRVEIVKNGVLERFLMSRDPIEGFEKSNGHGRAQIGFQTVTRQSNMFIETTRDHTYQDLREIMIKDLKEQGKDYGYLFMEVVGGFTMTGRFIPNAFNVTPIVVYRVYADGREDELVRGVDMIGTPLAMFSQISEAGGDPAIFDGHCGAESGSVPVSAVSPYIYVKMVETQRKDRSQDRPPILPRPDADADDKGESL